MALHHARHDLAASASALAASAAARPEGDGDLALLVGLNRGIVLLMTGRLDEAEVELADAAALAVRSGNAYAALRAGAYRTALVAARGQFRQVWALAQETITRGRETGLLGTLEIAGTMLLAAHSARQQLQGPVARGLAEQAAALMDGAGDLDTLLSSRALLALLDVEAGGDPLEGCRRLRAVWDAADGQSLSAPLVVHLAVNEHRCAWLAGRLDWAREAQARLEPLGPVGEAAVLAATEHLARGRWEAARHRLAPVLDGTTPCLMPMGLQQARLLEALLAEQAGQSARSLDALRAALQMGADSGALRVFLDVPGVDRLLDDNADRFGRLDAVAGQIRAAARGRADHAVVPITPRELTVLTDLPAQLTLEEIAARHQVSVNTVKTHVRSIYQKLGAANRRDAVATARRWGLLYAGQSGSCRSSTTVSPSVWKRSSRPCSCAPSATGPNITVPPSGLTRAVSSGKADSAASETRPGSRNSYLIAAVPRSRDPVDSFMGVSVVEVNCGSGGPGTTLAVGGPRGLTRTG